MFYVAENQTLQNTAISVSRRKKGHGMWQRQDDLPSCRDNQFRFPPSHVSRRDCAPRGPRSRWAQVSDPDPVCGSPDQPLPCSSSIHFLRREEKKKKKGISQTVAQGTPGSNEAPAAAGGTCPNTPQGAPEWGGAGQGQRREGNLPMTWGTDKRGSSRRK